MQTTKSKVIRAIGLWDLVLTLPFSLPFVSVYALEVLDALNTALSPHILFPEFLPFHVFFVQLFGILAVLWALVRIQKPQSYLAWYDSIGRFVVGLSMIMFSIQRGGAVPLLFSISELGLGLLQIFHLSRKEPIKRPE